MCVGRHLISPNAEFPPFSFPAAYHHQQGLAGEGRKMPGRFKADKLQIQQ